MFSVDNFYEIFKSYYAWPEKNNILHTFSPHGSKNWEDLIENNLDCPKSEDIVQWSSKNGALLMHDQEPFFMSYVDHCMEKYRYADQVDGFIKNNPGRTPEFKFYRDYYGTFNQIEFIHFNLRTTKIPIICHSEKNSSDIKYLEDHHWVSCYYWWHGMIARDWYRHWEKNNHLKTWNKCSTQHRFLIYSRAFDGTREYRKKIIEHLEKYKDQINYNWSGDDRSPELSATINIEDANTSAIHLVAETLFDTEKIYLTEKVFKPMVMCQPFILFAAPGSLQYLRDYGFKTFSHIWAEDYDTITDPALRKQEIFRLIDSIAELDDTRFESMYQELLPIIEYNRKHFYSNEFQNLLWNELKTNVDNALLQQQEMSKIILGGTMIYYADQYAKRNNFIPPRLPYTINNAISAGTLTLSQLKSHYPILFKHYQSQKYSLDNKS